MPLHEKPDVAQATGTRTTYADERAAHSAMFILSEAKKLGIAVGTDGVNVDMLVPAKVPWQTQKWFATKLHEFREQVIAIILSEKAAQEDEFTVDAGGRS